jgi:hypothetical protein
MGPRRLHFTGKHCLQTSSRENASWLWREKKKKKQIYINHVQQQTKDLAMCLLGLEKMGINADMEAC